MQRYLPQISVAEIGHHGQQRMNAAKVLIAGAGGLGTPLAAYLGAAGIGTIGIIDGDNIAVSNLSRQFLYHETETGLSKAEVLARRVNAQNPSIRVHCLPVMLDYSNAGQMISNYDIVCDCTDNETVRLLIDDTCGNLQKPLVYAAVNDWQGYVTVLHHHRKIPLNRIFSANAWKENPAKNCTMAGVVNAACGIAASIQAAEVIKIITGIESRLDGGILCIDASLPVFRLLELF